MEHHTIVRSLAKATRVSTQKLTTALDPLIKGSLMQHQLIRRLTREQIQTLEGLTDTEKVQLNAAIEAARILYTSSPDLGLCLGDPAVVAELIQDQIGHDVSEHGLVLALDVKHRLIGSQIISVGSSDECIIRTKEVFQYLVSVCAPHFFLAHNHPSGDVTPSIDDLKLTEQFFNASRTMGFHFLDHIIVSDADFTSIRRHMGYWYESN